MFNLKLQIIQETQPCSFSSTERWWLTRKM